MTDPRVERLAELVIDHSLELREGEILRIDGTESGGPLMLALHRAALRRGAHPYLNLDLEGAVELLLAEGTDEQLEYVSEIETREVDRADAIVAVWSYANTRSLTNVDATRHGRHLAARRELVNRFWKRVATNDARWCGTLHPSHAHAQDAEMSLRDYEQFVFGACHVLDGQDAIGYWEDFGARIAERAEALDPVRELRIVGPDTDLTVGLEGRTWLAGDARNNMPSGEVYTSPVEMATRGEIRFAFPGIYNGHEVDDVRLRFEGGRVVHAEAGVGGDYLASLLDLDDGARVLGEVAFGLNYEIDRYTRNILFDEKIGGTMHVALGAGFARAGSRNVSALHWDLICDLRADGEVYADGELVWRAGRFLEPVVARG